MSYEFDLFVIGAGSAGVRAARFSAGFGARVAVAESRYLGGTCVNVGCVPKKLMVYGAHYSEDFEQAKGYGWSSGEAHFDWPTLIANKNREISRLNGVYRNLLDNSGVTLLEGHARLRGPHEVEINGQVHTAEHIMIATGGWPQVPDIPGREHAITSNEVFFLEQMPKRVVVVGGGYIAVEFASIFNGLGAQVTQLYRGHQVLRGFDEEVRSFIAGEMAKSGVTLHLNTDVSAIERTEGGLQVRLLDGSHLTVDSVLYATGRVPLVEGLGLDAAGVRQGKAGAVEVNDQYQTSVPSIYAVGDVTARVQLTPVALSEAMVVVDALFGPPAGKEPRGMSYDFIPTAVFTHPNIGTVGYSELEASEKFGKISVYKSDFKALKHTLSGSTERTLMKLIVEDATDRVVGLHMVGADAGEIVQGFAVAMKAGATKAVFDATLGIHPTMAEEFVTMREPVKK